MIIWLLCLIFFLYHNYLSYKMYGKKGLLLVLIDVGLFVLGCFTNMNVLVYIVLFIIAFFLEYQRNVMSLVSGTLVLVSLVSLTILGYVYDMKEIFLSISAFIYLVGLSNQLYLRKTYEERVMEYQNKIMKHQVNEVNNIYLVMRGWRHDYHNHLQNLKAYLRMDQIEKAKGYLNELEEDLDNIYKLVDTGNVNVDAILNSKLSLAMKNDIDLNYKATVPKKLKVSDIDLCVILGNLIDNAIEACEKMEKDKFIRLYIGTFQKQLYISVSNSTNEVVRKLDEEYITTKRGNHGHGLKRINLEVEKYGGYINRKNEPGIFVTEIMLPL